MNTASPTVANAAHATNAKVATNLIRLRFKVPRDYSRVYIKTIHEF